MIKTLSHMQYNAYENPLWKEYARLVYKRDNYICNICKHNCRNGNRKPNAHHRLYYSVNGKLVEMYDYPLDGLNPIVVTLCEMCHYHLHVLHGFQMPIIDRDTGKLLNEDKASRKTRLEIEKMKEKEYIQEHNDIGETCRNGIEWDKCNCC